MTASIAYVVLGEVPTDLLFVTLFSNLVHLWQSPRWAAFHERVSSFARLILFDKRGTAYSDRPAELPSLEARKSASSCLPQVYQSESDSRDLHLYVERFPSQEAPRKVKEEPSKEPAEVRKALCARYALDPMHRPTCDYVSSCAPSRRRSQDALSPYRHKSVELMDSLPFFCSSNTKDLTSEHVPRSRRT